MHRERAVQEAAGRLPLRTWKKSGLLVMKSINSTCNGIREDQGIAIFIHLFKRIFIHLLNAYCVPGMARDTDMGPALRDLIFQLVETINQQENKEKTGIRKSHLVRFWLG